MKTALFCPVPSQYNNATELAHSLTLLIKLDSTKIDISNLFFFSSFFLHFYFRRFLFLTLPCTLAIAYL